MWGWGLAPVGPAILFGNTSESGYERIESLIMIDISLGLATNLSALGVEWVNTREDCFCFKLSCLVSHGACFVAHLLPAINYNLYAFGLSEFGCLTPKC